MNAMAKRMAISMAHALGYEVTPLSRADTAPQAWYLAKLFDHLGVDCVIDVGANRGQYHDFLRHEVDYQGLVVSYEPIPTLAQEIAARAKTEAAWRVEAFALGAEPGTATLNVMAVSEFSSFLAPSHAATDMFVTMNRVEKQVQVGVRTLDAELLRLQAALGFKRPYLKLDTQGYDMAVIAGARESLRTVVALQTEASVTPIYEGAPGFASAIRTLESLGFVLSGVYPNSPDHFPLMLEFDCHMVRRDLGKIRAK